MSKSKEKKLIIEIFKPKRGSSCISSNLVLQLPLFSTKIKWVRISDAQTDYVLDTHVYFLMRYDEEIPVDLVELCNKNWNTCVEHNLDSISFEYYYD